jgi:hypothetical protein
VIRRRLFNFTAAVSLLLCATAVTIWALSYSRLYYVSRFVATSRQITITTEPSTVSVSYAFYPPEWYGSYYESGWKRVASDLPPDYEGNWRANSLGFNVEHDDRRGALPYQGHWVSDEVVIPFWFIVVTCGFTPIVWLILAARCRQRVRSNRCVRCGYSLSGNTSGVCPECGAPVPAATGEESCA